MATACQRGVGGEDGAAVAGQFDGGNYFDMALLGIGDDVGNLVVGVEAAV